ncbi:MAG: deoxyribodipyrimidine photolyase [Polyangiaceae bacterium]|nr:deoxyribodipyrimidine photolyase [Polyangiaceae bacterium]MCB9609098.1 deoxyribodipyrimidine photolyase [Polyangiaceae bacterium]
MAVPELRITPVPRGDGQGPAPERPERDFVLYWMIANRRAHYNFALDRAIDHARRLKQPLVVLEALRVGYRWASDRLHAFVIQGMGDNQRSFAGSAATYLPYVEPETGAGSGLLQALAARASIVVTDEFPCFFLPDMVKAAANKLDVRLEMVDSNGVLPMRASNKAFERAFDFRRHLQKELLPHLEHFPRREPLKGLELPPAKLPKDLLGRWPAPPKAWLEEGAELDLASLPIDHEVSQVSYQGGSRAARKGLRGFVEDRLAYYAEKRSDAVDDNSSGLSPYLHFGHLSAHEVFRAVVGKDFDPLTPQSRSARGQKEGWWGLEPCVESFLDEVVTWREVGYNNCLFRKDYDKYRSLPDWAKQSLAEHAKDPRDYTYDLRTLEAGMTHDELWNAAQWQLKQDGRIHNYLRMLWGKKVLEWSKTPQQALETLIELNNKYAVDGRNPNSYSGIFWCFGRFDRAWGPERPIYGKIRYMSSDNTRRKMKVDAYLERWLPSQGRRLF